MYIHDIENGHCSFPYRSKFIRELSDEKWLPVLNINEASDVFVKIQQIVFKTKVPFRFPLKKIQVTSNHDKKKHIKLQDSERVLYSKLD